VVQEDEHNFLIIPNFFYIVLNYLCL